MSVIGNSFVAWIMGPWICINKFAIFLRKVDRSFPDSAIKEIMNIDFNHKYDVLHNYAKKKNNFFNNIITPFNIFSSLLLIFVSWFLFTCMFTENFVY